MNGKVRARPSRRWQIAIASLFLVVALGITAFALFQRERPPPPIVPATDAERKVLSMAEQFVQTRSTDFAVPIAIEPMTDGSMFVVSYWTPRRELELLGPREVIVNLELNTVEIPMRD